MLFLSTKSENSSRAEFEIIPESSYSMLEKPMEAGVSSLGFSNYRKIRCGEWRHMIAVIDYSMGNLKSVSKALIRVGGKVVITSSPRVAEEANGIILPGVGAFAQGIRNLEKRGFLDLLSHWGRTNKPLLGICLGMHLLFTEGEEGGVHRGLDLIKGRVKRFQNTVKVPHMGWNQVILHRGTFDDAFLQDIADRSYFYFAHSYYGEPVDTRVVLGRTEYGIHFASMVRQGNIVGVQFHPEKSDEIGLSLLGNFVRMTDKSLERN
jgi:glutamine amidotransferase